MVGDATGDLVGDLVGGALGSIQVPLQLPSQRSLVALHQSLVPQFGIFHEQQPPDGVETGDLVGEEVDATGDLVGEEVDATGD